MKRLLLMIVPLIALFGMNQFSTQAQSPLKVVATTSIIADVAKNVGGDLADVTAIIPADTDAHGYIPTPQDIALLVDADVVLVNGLGMEQGLLEIIEENAPDAYIVSLGITVLSSDHHHEDEHMDEAEATEEAHEYAAPEYLGIYGEDVECDVHHEDEAEETHAEGEEEHDHGACDPHVWQNPANVIIWTTNIATIFGEADPENGDAYLTNSQAYIAELATLSDDIQILVNSIPTENRVIVTNHNFLAYFASEYGFEIVGTVIPSASSMAQVAPQDIADLVEVIKTEGVKAIFAEYALSTDIAETVADEVGYEVVLVRLYSDSLGAEGSEASTYLDMIRYNVNAIVNALKG